METWDKIEYCYFDKRFVGSNTQLKEFELDIKEVHKVGKDNLFKDLRNKESKIVTLKVKLYRWIIQNFITTTLINVQKTFLNMTKNVHQTSLN